MPDHNAYFLPYQVRWLKDESRMKIWEKSRRIGATYVQAYEDVRDAAKKGGMDVWFSSADESSAREYILYCSQWAKLFDLAARDLGEIVIDGDKDIKAFVIEFSNGKRINALRSNPRAFRSKGGKVVLDEFAFHDDPDALWAAAKPSITWGYPIRVLSTHNGKGCRYFRMLEAAKKGESPFSLHATTIQTAVEEGLVDKILKRPASPAEREKWLEEERASCLDENTWLQEYCCIPVDEATAFLTYDMISSCEDPALSPAGIDLPIIGDCYSGEDIGRRKDLFVIWVLEKIGDVLRTREIVAERGLSFSAQDEIRDRIFQTYRPVRHCMDQTGMGEKPVEDAKKHHGEYRVEGLLFTMAVKQELAFGLRRKFEDRLVRMPADREIREDHHAVRKVTTASGNIRFDAERSEAGHADRFWAHALAIHAAETEYQPVEYETVVKGRFKHRGVYG